MHKTTNEQLSTIARWTREIAAADSVATELDAVAIEQTGDCDTWSSIGNSLGTLTVFIYDALAIADASPTLRKLRQLGFKRQGKPTEKPDDGTIEWSYRRGKYSDDDSVDVGVKLTLKKADADGDAPSCEYVKVGTKEVPDMRLLCGEELEAFKAEQVEA